MAAQHHNTLEKLNSIVDGILDDLDGDLLSAAEKKMLSGALKEILDCRRMEELMMFKSEMEQLVSSIRNRKLSQQDTLDALGDDVPQTLGTVAETTIETTEQTQENGPE